MTDWEYHSSSELDKKFTERLKKFPREPDILVYGLRTILIIIVRLWLKIYHRIEIQGKENIPPSGPFILVSNHTSHLDVVCLQSALPFKMLHHIFPLAAKDYFFQSFPRLALATIMVNALPFDRKNRSYKSIKICHDILSRSKNILLLFPEGTRTSTGKLNSFKPGIGLLVAGSTTPVVPCYLIGTFKSLPKKSFFPIPSKIIVRIGEPKYFNNYNKSKESITQIAEDLQQAVGELEQL